MKLEMEEKGFEPLAFRMQSEHSTTELHPLDISLDDVIWMVGILI